MEEDDLPAAPPEVTPAPVENDMRVQVKPGKVTTHVRNAIGELVAWDTIRELLESRTKNVPQVAEEYHLKPKTIYERAKRHKWKLVHSATLRARKRLAKKVAAEIMEVGAEGMDWNKAGEQHRTVAFKIAHQSVAKFKPRAPKTFRELEAADKIARRAAGLEVAEVQQNTLIQVNELINEAEPEVLEASQVPPAIDGEVSPSLSGPQPLPAASPDSAGTESAGAPEEVSLQAAD